MTSGPLDVVGVLTLENVLERLLMTEIKDEKDKEKLRSGLKNRTNSAMTKNEGLSTISAEDQQVFKSKFVMRYFNRLYSDIKETLRNESTTDDAPHFGQQRTVSVLGRDDGTLEVPRELGQSKRANTALNSSVQMRRQAAELMTAQINQATIPEIMVEEDHSLGGSASSKSGKTNQGSKDQVWSQF